MAATAALTCSLGVSAKFACVTRNVEKSTSRSATATRVVASAMMVPSSAVLPSLLLYAHGRVQYQELLVVPARDLRFV